MIRACVVLVALLCSSMSPTKLTAVWATPGARVGEPVELAVTVTGECAVDAELLPLPALDAATFDVIDGPTTTTTETGDYRCAWRVVATPRLPGPLTVPVRVLCQSSDEVVVDTAPLDVTGDAADDAGGSFELRTSAATVFVGEPFTVEFDVRCVASMFRRADVEFDLPWLHDVVVLDAATVPDAVVAPVTEQSMQLRFASKVLAGRMRLGTTLTVVAPEPGRLTWAGARLRAKLRDTTAANITMFPPEIDADAGSVDVVALPAAGKPADFVDAVGRYRVDARTDRNEVTVGEPFTLTLRVDALQGDAGNLAVATLPHTWALPGFRVALRDDGRGDDALTSRRVVFELRAERAGVGEIPSIAIPSFDPKSKTYVVARSELIPMRIMERESASSDAADGRSAFARPAVIAAIALAVLAAFGFAIVSSKRRARGAAPQDPRGAFEHALAVCAPDDALAHSKALARAVHAATGVDAGALFGGGARVALIESGLAPELVERIAMFIDADEDAAFAAHRDQAVAKRERLDEARSLVEALSHAH